MTRAAFSKPFAKRGEIAREDKLACQCWRSMACVVLIVDDVGFHSARCSRSARWSQLERGDVDISVFARDAARPGVGRPAAAKRAGRRK
ncbi:MAG: hypothetical protein IPN07_07090 [Dehalococcoidia bacterium]|nr:hypothetical protein [Dehalococcoidia bacterium]